MKNGNTHEFLETISAQDAYVDYHGRHFFVNGCCQEWDRKTKKTIWARIEMYEMADVNCSKWIADVCSITKPTVGEVMAEFTRIPPHRRQNLLGTVERTRVGLILRLFMVRGQNYAPCLQACKHGA